MDKAQKWMAGVGAVLAAVVGALAGMDYLPEPYHKYVMVALAILTALGLSTKKIGATGGKAVEESSDKDTDQK